MAPSAHALREKEPQTIEHLVDGSAVDVGDYIDEESEIEIESYDPKSGLYHVINTQYPKTDWFFATARSLSRAVPVLLLNELKERPKSIVGFVYTTARPLLLTDPDTAR